MPFFFSPSHIPGMARMPHIRATLMPALLLATLPLASCATTDKTKLVDLEQRVAVLEAESGEIKREVVNAHLGVQNLDTRVEFLERETAKNGVVIPFVPKRSITPEGMAAVQEGNSTPYSPTSTPAAVNPSNPIQNQTPQNQASAPATGTSVSAAVPSSASNNALPYSPSTGNSETTVPAVSGNALGNRLGNTLGSPPANPAGPQTLLPASASASTPAPVAVSQGTPAPSSGPQPLFTPNVVSPASPTGPTGPTGSTGSMGSMGSMGQPEAQPPAQPAPPTQQPTAQPAAQATTQATAQATPQPAPTNPEQKAYDMGLQLYRTGRFAEAEAAFTAFMQAYPQSRLVPNALYWKGETHYARKQYTDAIFAFKDVQTRYPRDNKTPDSLLKTAMAYQKLGDTGNASLHLSVLFEDWPKSEATQRARQMGLKP